MGLAPWPKWIWMNVAIFLIVLCLLFSIARRARILEEPKLAIQYGNDRIYLREVNCDTRYKTQEINIAVTNLSAIKISNVEIKLANIVSLDGKETFDIDMILQENNSMGRDVSLNPFSTKYFALALFNKISNQNINYPSNSDIPIPKETCITIGGNAPVILKGNQYRIKLKVSGDVSRETKAYFNIGITENETLTFEPE